MKHLKPKNNFVYREWNKNKKLSLFGIDNPIKKKGTEMKK
jgi:hypothetical protein